MKQIKDFLPNLKIELHPEKSSILPLRNGITFLGYRIFYHHRLLKVRNIKSFNRRLKDNIELFNKGIITSEQLNCRIQGWLGYSRFANTFNLNKKLLENSLK